MTAVNLAGYHLTYDAEMTYASDMNYLANTFNNGDRTIPVNGELQYYQSYDPSSPTNPFSFQNGALVITASPNPQGGLPYTSGLVTTGQSHYQNQGYFETRLAMPSTSGFWPTFWLLAGGPTNYSTEVDINEEPNNNGVQNYFTSIKDKPALDVGVFQNTGVDLTAYHTYGLLWTASTMQFTFDGQLIGLAYSTPANLATQQMYMLLDLAVGGWAANPATGASAQMKVDYIRSYSNDPSVGSWGLGTVSSPDGVDTTPNYGLEPNYYQQSLSTPTQTQTQTQTPTPTPTPITPAPTTTTTTTTGTTDTLIVGVSEDAYQGDAQYKIYVDGYVVGGATNGIYTTTASHAAGQVDLQTITGSWGTGAHKVGIQFLNDLYGSASADRNLYINSVAYDGTTVTSGTVEQATNGTTTVNVPSTTAPSLLTLHLAEDAYKGDAQFVVTVDGTQLAAAQSVTTLKSSGGSQAFTFSDVLAAGKHDVGITFTNDLWGGSASADRNLYVTGADLNGTAQSASAWTAALFSNGTTHFNLVVPSA